MNKELIGETIELDNGSQYMVLNIISDDNNLYAFLMSLNDKPELTVATLKDDSLYLIKDDNLKNRLIEKYKNKENH